MLLLQQILAMRAPLRLAALATVFASSALGQTYSNCNPTQQTDCPADAALGTSVNIDFISASDSFTPTGNPTYGSDGVSFTVAQSGDAPQLTSKWYIMFGKYEVTMKAAPGAGIVSSCVLQSDDLDEIDWEWLGAQDNQVQSNYFGKGQTTTFDRAAVHAVTGTQDETHTYTVEWTSNQIVWQIDGTTVRVLDASDADGQYPQTPMQLKIGAWSGGDPSNPAGTIAWAQGPTNYADGPFTMVVQSISVNDYSTGTSYSYQGTSGTWESIQAAGGSVNGDASATDVAAPAITSSSSGDVVPFDGTHRSTEVTSTPSVGDWGATATMQTSATVTNTNYPGLPSGWTVNGSGKVVPPSAAPSTYLYAWSTSSPAPSEAASCSASGIEVITSYDQQGFLTTATLPAGASVRYNQQGALTTVLPSGCSAAASSQTANGSGVLTVTAEPLGINGGESKSTSGSVATATGSSEAANRRELWAWTVLVTFMACLISCFLA